MMSPCRAREQDRTELSQLRNLQTGGKRVPLPEKRPPEMESIAESKRSFLSRSFRYLAPSTHRSAPPRGDVSPVSVLTDATEGP